MAATLTNAMSVDVEDYFQVSAMAPYIERNRWESIECRVERNMDNLLEMFARKGANATFFVLGWIAERHPRVVKAIVQAGHELASHGFAHLRATDQSPGQFREDITKAKTLLEDISGVSVRGYRAPSFSIGKHNLWAFDALLEAGYAYSSSVYPVRHDHYGFPEAPREPYASRQGLVEIPITTLQIMGRNLPAGGGGYFRLAPYGISRWTIQRINERDRRPAIFYFHPWEIDPDQPRIPGIDFKTRFRHYLNLRKMKGRLENLVADFRWDRMDRVFAAELQRLA